MREYIVKYLNHTMNAEKDFNLDYHRKYLDKVGEVINHPCKEGIFIDFVCLGFDKNNQGQFTDADWFHKNDLGIPSLWGFTFGDLKQL